MGVFLAADLKILCHTKWNGVCITENTCSCREPDLLYDNSLLYDGNCPEEKGNKRSIYEILQIASIALADTAPLQELFGIPNNKIVKELNSFDELSLFLKLYIL